MTVFGALLLDLQRVISTIKNLGCTGGGRNTAKTRLFFKTGSRVRNLGAGSTFPVVGGYGDFCGTDILAGL
jgi:hypothetical protein